MRFKHLFKSGRIGKLWVKNRLVMPPMVRNYATRDGQVTDRYVKHIERIAKGGVGVMILEASYISPEGKGFVNQLGIHNDETIAGLRRLVRAAHRYGAVIGPQLYHAGRQTSSKTTGREPVAPSAVADPTIGEHPHHLTQEEVEKIVQKFAEAARRAVEAGCDFVEIHGAHGYLITQFLSNFSNHRLDRYGGSIQNRMRFLTEVFQAVREEVGEDFPISVRLSADEMVPGGIRLEDTITFAKHLENIGADALHISVGNYASYAQGLMIPPMAIKNAPLVRLAKRIKDHVEIPVIAVGKIRFPALAESIIRDEEADYVAIGRTLLADPDWPLKARRNEVEEINTCVACNQGCISRLFAQLDVQCTVNPECGREEKFSLRRRQNKKKIVVAGGGPAGMAAAIYAAQRGHKVSLFEKESRLGGQLIPAAASLHREDWELLRAHLMRQIKELGVRIHLNKELTVKEVEKARFDAAIIAIGSSPGCTNIPGAERENVISARDLFEKKVHAKGDVVVAGGGCMGAQAAEYLAENNHFVTIVETSGDIAVEAPSNERALLLGRLKKLKVKVIPFSKISSIGADSVMIENKNGLRKVKADTVVICFGSCSNNGLSHELKTVLSKIIIVGDAKQPRRITDAIAEGALAALELS